jgi:hypothetical protein
MTTGATTTLFSTFPNKLNNVPVRRNDNDSPGMPVNTRFAGPVVPNGVMGGLVNTSTTRVALPVTTNVAKFRTVTVSDEIDMEFWVTGKKIGAVDRPATGDRVGGDVVGIEEGLGVATPNPMNVSTSSPRSIVTASGKDTTPENGIKGLDTAAPCGPVAPVAPVLVENPLAPVGPVIPPVAPTGKPWYARWMARSPAIPQMLILPVGSSQLRFLRLVSGMLG